MFAISSSISIGSYYTSGADFPSDIPGNIANWRVSSTDAAKTMGARAFTASSSMQLDHVDNASLSRGDFDWSISLWVTLDSTTGYSTFASQNDPGINQRSWSLWYHKDQSRFVFTVSGDGTTSTEFSLAAHSLGAPATDTWYHIYAEHDASANQLLIRVNDTHQDTASHTPGTHDSTADFSVGSQRVSGTPGNYMDGRISGVGLWDRVLTAAERTYMFNSGLGRSASEVNSHASLGNFGSGTSVDFWPLNEASGNAISVTGNNNLTDNNSVGSADGPATINAADSAGDNTGTLTNFTAGGGAYTTSTAHGTFDPTAEDTSSNTNHGALNHDYLEVWDKSGNGNVGTMTGFADGLTPRITSLKTGASGKGLRFDGVDDEIDTGANPTAGIGALSISVWVRFSDTGVTYDNILSDYNSGAEMSVDLRKGNNSTDNDIDFIVRTSSDVVATYSGAISGWLHLVGTYDGANVKLYVNSVLADTQAQTGSTDTSPNNLEIGHLPNVAGRHLDGDLADLRIFSFALTSEQITYLFEDYTGSSSEPLNDPGKPDLLWYDFEDDPRQSDTPWAIEDESTNNNFAMPVGIGVANPLSTDVPAVLKDESSNENVGKFVGFSEADPRSTKTVALTKDSSTNSNHLSMIGFSGVLDPTTAPIEGATGTGVHFDGTDDYLSAGDQGELDFGSSDFSIACWFKTSVSSGNHELVRKGESFRYLLRLDSSGNVILEIDDDTTLKSVTSTGTYDDGSWHFAVGVRDGNTLRLFVDAVAEGTTDITGYGALDDAVAFTIGAESTESNFFSGEMDDVRVFSSALSASEVLGLYNLHRNEPIGSGTDPGAANLVGHWKLDKGSTRAIEFDGTDDYVRAADDSTLDFGTGDYTVALWFMLNTTASNQALISKGLESPPDSVKNGWALRWRSTNEFWFQEDANLTATITASQTLVVGKHYHLAIVRSGTTVTMYLDGASIGSGTSSADVDNAFDVLLGRIEAFGINPADYLDGLLEDIRLYAADESSAITYIRNERLGATGGTAPTTSPVAHYKGENLLTASGKSMPFNGTDQALDIGDNYDPGTSDFSITGWFKTSASSHAIIGKRDSGAYPDKGWAVEISPTGKLQGVINETGPWDGSTMLAQGTVTVNDGFWHHAAVTFDRDGNMTVYTDAADAQTNNISAQSASIDTNNPAYIGAQETSSLTSFFNGSLQNLKYYSRVLTAAEVQYDRESALGMSGGTDPTTTNLTGHWITSQLSNAIARIAADSSSSGNDATIVSKDIGTALSTSVVSGASGSCLVNTLDEYVRLDEHVDDYKSDAYGSIAGWFKTAGTAGDQVLFSASDRGDSNSEFTIKLTTAGVIDIIIQDAGSATLELTASTGLDDDAWHHFAFGSSASSNTLYIDGASVTPTYSTGSASTQAWLSNIADLDTMRIGAKVQSDVLSSHWEGSLDDVRYYSEYQLTAANAEFLYDNFRGVTGGTAAGSTDLTGHWTFDVLSAETAGKSLAFNNADNQVTVTADSSTNNIFTGGGSAEAWIKPNSDGGGNLGRIFDKDPAATGTGGWMVFVSNESGGYCKITFLCRFSSDGQWTTTNADIPLGVWSHVAVTYDDGDVGNVPIVYVNKVAVAVTTDFTPGGSVESDSANKLALGNRDAGDRAFDGLIRGARCYTEILSADEVENRYGEGLRLYGGLSAVEPPKGSIAMALEFSESNERSVATLKDGMSLEFDGVDEFVSVGDVTSLKITGDLTLMCWLRTQDGTNNQRLISKWDNVGTQSYFLALISGVPRFRLNRTTAQTVDAVSTVADGNWHHIAGVNDGTNLLLYVDGVLVASSAAGGSIDDTAVDLELGRGQLSSDRQWFSGDMDDPRVYAQAVTASEIYDIYTGADNTTGLVLHHKYDTPANPAGLQGDQINRVLSQDTPPLDANQIVQANRASLAVGANGLVNQSVLEFAGSPESHEISSYLKDTYYIAMALQTGSSAFSADQVALSFSDTASTTKYFAPICIDASGNPFILWSNGGTETRLTATGITLTTSTTYVFEIWSLNGKYYLKVNGTEYALTVDTGSNDGAINFDDGDVTTLGALRTTSVQKYFEGKIAHWTAYNNVPTVADRTLVRNFLGITYGVTIAS